MNACLGVRSWPGPSRLSPDATSSFLVQGPVPQSRQELGPGSQGYGSSGGVRFGRWLGEEEEAEELDAVREDCLEEEGWARLREKRRV